MPVDYQYSFDLRHLVQFREVARRLHFRRAAEALAIAQPALSRTVAQLEDMVGAILREVHRRYPDIRLELNESPTAAQLVALERGELACGFFHPDAPTPNLRTRLLLREANGVLLPASHPLVARPSLRLRDLAETPFVLFPRSHNPGFYDRVLAACARAGFAPRIAEEVWPRQNAVGLVRSGLGVHDPFRGAAFATGHRVSAAAGSRAGKSPRAGLAKLGPGRTGSRGISGRGGTESER